MAENTVGKVIVVAAVAAGAFYLVKKFVFTGNSSSGNSDATGFPQTHAAFDSMQNKIKEATKIVREMRESMEKLIEKLKAEKASQGSNYHTKGGYFWVGPDGRTYLYEGSDVWIVDHNTRLLSDGTYILG